MKNKSHLFLSVLLISTLMVTVSCKSMQGVQEEGVNADASSNVAPRISNNTEPSRAITDINPSLPLIEHIRQLSGVQVYGKNLSYIVHVRGASYLLGNNNPLFVIDGIPFGHSYDDVASSVSMYNVTEVRLVRGSERTRRFGSRGSTGVIEIITRRTAAH